VADEVRKLAEQASSAVQNIQDLTLKVEQAFQNLSGNANDVLSFIENQVKPDYEFTISSSKRYEEDALFYNNLSQEIGTSMDMVNKTIQEVKKAIENVSATAQETAASSEEIHINVKETTSAVGQVAKASQDQALLSERLNDMIQKFKI
jgi:methyl-accepting chemotaxis protein